MNVHKTRERQIWLDNLKGAIILSVVLGHCPTFNYPPLMYLNEWIFIFHMPLFFIISGYSFHLIEKLVKENKRQSKQKQFINIAIIYIIQSILYICINVLCQNFIKTTNIVSVSDIGKILLSPVAHLWYLHALLLFYILDVLHDFLVKKGYVTVLVLFLVFVGSIFCEHNYISKLMFMFIFFEFGKRLEYIQKLPVYLGVVGLLFSLYFPYINDNTWYYSVIRLFIVVCIADFFVHYFNTKLDKKVPLLTNIGINCIWIYLFHSYFTSVAGALCDEIFEGYPMLKVIIIMFIGTIGPMFLLVILKKIKLDYIISKPIVLFKHISKERVK